MCYIRAHWAKYGARILSSESNLIDNSMLWNIEWMDSQESSNFEDLRRIQLLVLSLKKHACTFLFLCCFFYNLSFYWFRHILFRVCVVYCSAHQLAPSVLSEVRVGDNSLCTAGAAKQFGFPSGLRLKPSAEKRTHGRTSQSTVRSL